MAQHGIIVDVGFTSDVKGYIDQIEKDFQKVDFADAIGISKAFDNQINEVRDKIRELKKDIDKMQEGFITPDAQNQLKDVTKSVKTLQDAFKLLMQNMPKNKQSALSDQLNTINAELVDTTKVTEHALEVMKGLKDAKFVNNNQIAEITKLYKAIERARQSTEQLDKLRKKIGDTPYSNTDEIITDIKAQMNAYGKLATERDKILKSKKPDKDALFADNTANITNNITKTIQLINTVESMAGKEPLSKFQYSMGRNLQQLKDQLNLQLSDLVQSIADQKVQLQNAFSQLGGGELSDIFKKSERKESPINVAIDISPGARKKIYDKCVKLINKVSEDLEKDPIQIRVQLITAYQSKKNAQIIKDLKEQIAGMEEKAQEAIANGVSASEAAKFTSVSNNLSKLINRMNQQIDNAMIFTVEVNTSTAINTVNNFIDEVKEKLPKIKPDMELSAAAKKSFKAQVNSFIKELNKNITKIQAEKDKMNNDVFTSYIQQLTDVVKMLKEFSASLNKGDFINIEGKTQQLHNFKETFDKTVAGMQLELINAFDPEKNNLGVWSNTLLATLRTAIAQIEELSKYKVFQIDNTQTKQATTEMVDTAETSTADAQQSNSPSKVAEKLGEYWGEGYAKGILNSKPKIKNAIRALVEENKLTMLDLTNDKMHQTISQDVWMDKANNTKLTPQTKQFQDIIKQFDAYKSVITIHGIKTPTDPQLKQSVLEMQKKNLEDIRKGAIDATKAIENLQKAFGGKFSNGNAKPQYRRYWSEEFTTPAGIPAARADNIEEKHSNPMLGIKRIDPEVIQNVVRMRKEVDTLLNQLQTGKPVGEYTEEEIIKIDEKITRLTQKLNAFKANALFTDNTLEEQPFKEINKWLDSWAKLSIEKEQSAKSETQEIKQIQQVQIEQTTNAIQNHKLEEKEIDKLIEKYKKLRDTKNATVDQKLEKEDIHYKLFRHKRYATGFTDRKDATDKELEIIKQHILKGAGQREGDNYLRVNRNLLNDRNTKRRDHEAIRQILMKVDEFNQTGDNEILSELYQYVKKSNLSKLVKPEVIKDLTEYMNKFGINIPNVEVKQHDKDFAKRNQQILDAIKPGVSHGEIYFNSLDEAKNQTQEYTEALKALNYEIKEIQDKGRYGATMKITPIDDKAITDLNKARHILFSMDDKKNTSETSTLPSQLDKITQAENKMGNEAQKVTEQVTNSLDKEQKELEETFVKIEDEYELFKQLIQILQNRKVPFIDTIMENIPKIEPELRNVLDKLGLIDAGVLDNSKMGMGASFGLGLLGNNYAMVTRPINNPEGDYKSYYDKLINRLNSAKEAGANVSTIFDVIIDKEHQMIYEIQSLAKGEHAYEDGLNSFFNPSILEATDDQLKKLIDDLIILGNNKLSMDYYGDNIKFDNKLGFSLFDISLVDNVETATESVNKFFNMLQKRMVETPDNIKFFERIKKISSDILNNKQVNSTKKEQNNSAKTEVDKLNDAFERLKKQISEKSFNLKTKEGKDNLNIYIDQYKKYWDIARKLNVEPKGLDELISDKATLKKFEKAKADMIAVAKQKQSTKPIEQKPIEQQANEQSKVAQMLGEYWGTDYAKGILNSQDKVKDAIRALVEEDKLTSKELNADTVHESISSDVFDEYIDGTKVNKNVAKYQQIIKILSEYREAIKNVKIPKEEGQFRNNVLEAHAKNLQDIRSGAINAETALKKLQDIYNANAKPKTTTLPFDELLNKTYPTTNKPFNWDIKQLQQELAQIGQVGTTSVEEVAKSEEKPISKTQQLIEQFETLKTLFNAAYSDSNVQLLERYVKDMTELNAQMGKSSVKGGQQRKTDIATATRYLEKVKNNQPISFDELMNKTYPASDKSSDWDINQLQQELSKIGQVATESTEQITKLEEKSKSKTQKTQITDVTAAINKKTEAFQKEQEVVTEAVEFEISKLRELRDVIKTEIPNAIKEKNSAFGQEKSIVKGAVDNEIKNIKALNKEQEKEAKKQEEDKLYQKATNTLTKRGDLIRKSFTDMLADKNQRLVDVTFEPTKKGLIEIKALIKDVDDSYKSFIYTTNGRVAGSGGVNFKLQQSKQGFNVEKQGASYEKHLEELEKAKNAVPNIGHVEPNTPEMERVIALAKKFKIEWEEIDRVIRNVDHGIESFQFYKKNGDRTTLGVNSKDVLWEREYVVQITDDIENFKKEIANLPKIIKDGIANYDANAGAKYTDALKEIASLWQKIREYQKMGSISDEEMSSLNKLFGGSVQTVQDRLSAILPTNNKMPEIVKQVSELQTNFKNLFKEVLDGGYSIEDAENKFTELISQAKNLYQNIGLDESKLAKPVAIDKLLANIGDELSRNTKMAPKFREQLNALVAQIQSMGYAIPDDQLKKFAASFQSLRSQIHLAGQTGKNFFDQMGQSIGRSVISFANMYLSVYRLISYIRQGIAEVSNLNKALTTISYTMDITDNQIKQMSNNIVQMSKDLSISVDNVSKIYQIYANMNTTAEEMLQTAKPTAILTNLSGVDASTAADQIQGVLNQFNLLAEESQHIVDVYDYISSNISVDYSKGIAGMSDAVRNVGNVAKEAGLSFEQLSAIIGKVMAKTRQDGSSIGNALRTILVRTTKASKLAGDEVDNATLSKASQSLHNIGVEVYTAEGEFREFDVIMTELADKWKRLSDAQQANISFQIAATRQTATLKAILDQWTDSMNLATEATKTNGNALANNEKYEKSLAGQTQALKNEVSQFWINTVSSDLVGDMLKELREFVGELNKSNSAASALVQTFGDLLNILLKLANVTPSGTTLGLLLGLTKGKNLFTNLNPMGGFNVRAFGLRKTFMQNAVTANDIVLFQQYANQLQTTTDQTALWNNTMANATNQAQTLARKVSTNGKNINAVMQTMEGQLKRTTIVAKAFNVALSVIGTVVITAVIKKISDFVHAEENFTKASENMISSYNQTVDSINTYKKQIQELQIKINDEGSSTKEVVEAKTDLFDIQSKLIEQFGNVAGGVDLITAAINGEIDALERLKDEAWEEELAKFEEENKGSLGSLPDQTFMPILEWIGSLVTDKETAQDFLQKYIDKNHGYYNVGEQATINWLNGDNTNASFARKYFEKEILKKQYNEQYSGLVALNQEYADAVKSVEGVTAQKMQEFADRYTDLISIFSEVAQEKIGTIFTNLSQNVTQNNQRLNNEAEMRKILINQVTEWYERMVGGVIIKDGEILSKDLAEDSGWVEQNILDALNIKTTTQFTVLKNALADIETRGVFTFEELTKTYEKFIKKVETPPKKSLSDWLAIDSNVSNGKDSNYTRNELIDKYESSINTFEEYLTNLREGKVEVDLSKIVQITADPTSLFQQLNMDDFENYLKQYQDKTTAILAYIANMRKKLLSKNGLGELNIDSLADQDVFKLLDNIEKKVLGISNNIPKLDNSYNELKQTLEDVRSGQQYDAETLSELIAKYPELTDAVKKNSDGTFSLYEDKLQEAITNYAKLYNQEVTATYVGVKGALETALAVNRLNLSLDQAIALYDKFNNPQDYDKIHYEKVFGEDSDHIRYLIEQYNAALKEFQALKNEGLGDGNGSGDRGSQYDWLDSYLEKRNRKVQKLQTAYNNLGKEIIKTGDIEAKYYQKANQSLSEENQALDEQIAAYNKAANQYEQRMGSGVLYNAMVDAFKGDAGTIIQKIKDQESIDLSLYTSAQQSAISEMASNWQKYLDAEDKILEAEMKKRENDLTKFTNNIEAITSEYDHILYEFANRQAELEHYQTMRTNAGMLENQQYYIGLLDNETRKLQANIDERQRLTEEIKKFNPENKDEIDQWWETKKSIDETTKSIWENQESIESLRMSMKQLSWDLNERIRGIGENLRNETDFLMSVLGTFEKDMYAYDRQFLGNDAEKTKIYNGQMSAEGLSVLALHRVNAKSYREDIEALNKEIKETEADYLENTANTTILDRLIELKNTQQELIKNYNSEREAIVDLVNDGYQKQLQSLDALSTKYMEALQSEKDLYNYQKNIAKQTKNIANIRKQIMAYSGDDEESRMRVQQLRVQLEEAEEGLADTQSDRAIQQQQQILDHLYQAMEDTFNDALEHPEKILKATESLVNDNMPTIKDTLNKSLDFYDTTLSNSLNNILGEDGIKKIYKNIDTADGDIQGITKSVTDSTTEMQEYWDKYNIDEVSEQDIKHRMKTLYGEGQGSFVSYFDDFNSKLDDINTSLLQAQTYGALQTAAETAVGAAMQIVRDDNAILTPLKLARSVIGDAVVNAVASPTSLVKGLVTPGETNKSANVVNNNQIAPTIVVNGVKNVSEFLTELQKNKNFEAMVQAMTINPLLAGGATSSLAKNKFKFN